MKKLILSLMILATAALSAQQVKIEGIYYTLNADNHTAKVSQKEGYLYRGDITIPATVTYEGNQYLVTAIGAGAFNGSKGLHSVTLPGTLTTVEGAAFVGCDSLKQPVLNPSIFVKMPRLYAGKYVIPYRTATIAPGAFEDCKLMMTVVMYDGITEIGDRAFYGCKILKQLELPKTVVRVGTEALDGRYLERIAFAGDQFELAPNAFSVDWMSATVRVPEGTNESLFPDGVNFEYFAIPKPAAPVVVTQPTVKEEEEEEGEAKPQLTKKEKEKLAAQKAKEKKKAQAQKEKEKKKAAAEKAKAAKQKAAAKKKAAAAKKKAAAAKKKK